MMTDQVTPFQKKCLRRLQQVVEDHGHSVLFDFREGDAPGFIGEFDHDGKVYSLQVYADTVVMHEGARLYEAYMKNEFRDDEALIEGFAGRLSRFLGGGPWEGDDEVGWFGRLSKRLSGRNEDEV